MKDATGMMTPSPGVSGGLLRTQSNVSTSSSGGSSASSEIYIFDSDGELQCPPKRTLVVGFSKDLKNCDFDVCMKGISKKSDENISEEHEVVRQAFTSWLSTITNLRVFKHPDGKTKHFSRKCPFLRSVSQVMFEIMVAFQVQFNPKDLDVMTPQMIESNNIVMSNSISQKLVSTLLASLRSKRSSQNRRHNRAIIKIEAEESKKQKLTEESNKEELKEDATSESTDVVISAASPPKDKPRRKGGTKRKAPPPPPAVVDPADVTEKEAPDSGMKKPRATKARTRKTTKKSPAGPTAIYSGHKLTNAIVKNFVSTPNGWKDKEGSKNDCADLNSTNSSTTV